MGIQRQRALECISCAGVVATPLAGSAKQGVGLRLARIELNSLLHQPFDFRETSQLQVYEAEIEHHCDVSPGGLGIEGALEERGGLLVVLFERCRLAETDDRGHIVGVKLERLTKQFLSRPDLAVSKQKRAELARWARVGRIGLRGTKVEPFGFAAVA
jgi:hypothetical protein